MTIHGLAQTYCNALQGATQQLEDLKLNGTSPQEEQTVTSAVRRARLRRDRERDFGKHCSMREAFVGGTGLLRKAARLATFDDVALDLCFWDPSCSSWVGVVPQHPSLTSRSIREFKDGRAALRKRLRSLRDGIENYVTKFGVPYRLNYFDPFKKQWDVIVGAPEGCFMDFKDWERACENRVSFKARSRMRTRSRRVTKAWQGWFEQQI